MLPRPPRLIWRLLAAELAKGVLLSTGAIVLVVAFGATVKPVAEGAIGALDAIKFMAVATVPMLQYALPFGAGMAATLGYHRFASENEATAAAAGGVSHASLIAPALAAGLALGLALLALTGTVSPRFTRTLESIVTRDAASSIVRQIERGESVQIDDVILHADRAFQVGADPDTGAIDYFILEGVVAAAVDGATGGLSADVAASRADVWLYPAEQEGEDVVAVYMVVGGGVAKQRGEALISLRKTEFGPWIVPGALGDDLDYMTDPQLAAVAENPESFRPVRRRRDQAAAELAEARARTEIADTLAATAALALNDPAGGRIALRDARLAPAASVPQADPPADPPDDPAGGPRVEPRVGEADAASEPAGRLVLVPSEGAASLDITWRREDGTLRQLRAASAALEIDVSPRDAATRIALTLSGVESDRALEGRRDELAVGTDLRLPADPAPRAFRLPAADLIEIARATEDPAIAKAGADLAGYILDVKREANANRHERAALSVAGFIMTPLGAIMALRLRESIPLHVYLWSFFPALACVIIASGGSSIAEAHGAPGLAVIWSGCAAFALFALFEFVRLRRH